MASVVVTNSTICANHTADLQKHHKKLLDDLGTSSGSRYVQMYNGRAIIRVKTNGGKSVVSAKVDGVSSVFLQL